MTAVSDLIGVLLPGGVAAGAVLLIQAVKSWREGKQSQEETAIQRWQKLAREAEERQDIAEQDEAYAIILANYWRQRSADLEYVMRVKGVSIPPPQSMPTKRRRGVKRDNRKAVGRTASAVDVDETE